MRSLFVFAFLLSLGLTAPQATNASVVLDFEDLRSETGGLGVLNNPIYYQSQGFRLEIRQVVGTGSPRFLFAGTLSDNFAGSTALYENAYNGVILKRDDQAAFTFNSIDISEWIPTNPLGGTISFTGEKSDGTYVSQDVTFDGTFGFETFQFTGFDDVVEVSWTQIEPSYQFDNIVLNASSSSAVPEPATIATWLAGGLLGLVAFRTRKKKSLQACAS